MTRVARVIGWTWLVAPIALFAYEIWLGATDGYPGFKFYLGIGGALLALALCGAWFLIGGPGAKWVLRVAAVLVALYLVLGGLISESNAPYSGGRSYSLYAYLALGVAFCALTCFVAGRRAA